MELNRQELQEEINFLKNMILEYYGCKKDISINIRTEPFPDIRQLLFTIAYYFYHTKSNTRDFNNLFEFNCRNHHQFHYACDRKREENRDFKLAFWYIRKEYNKRYERLKKKYTVYMISRNGKIRQTFIDVESAAKQMKYPVKSLKKAIAEKRFYKFFYWSYEKEIQKAGY